VRVPIPVLLGLLRGIALDSTRNSPGSHFPAALETRAEERLSNQETAERAVELTRAIRRIFHGAHDRTEVRNKQVLEPIQRPAWAQHHPSKNASTKG